MGCRLKVHNSLARDFPGPRDIIITIRHFTIALALLLLGATVHAQSPSPDLYNLISKRDLTGLETAIKDGADVNQRQSEGLEATPLMWATGSEADYIRVLLEAGAEVNVRDAMGDPAINWAAYYGNAPAIALLLEAGAETQLTGHGNAVEIVMRRGHQAALALLLDHREFAPKRSRAEIVLEVAAIQGEPETITVISGQLDVASAHDWAGRPVLQAAARANQAAAVQTLINAGFPVDAQDAIGFTALFEAARDGSNESVNVLIAAGANVNHISGENALSLTALHLAAIGNHVEIIDALLTAGANPDAIGTMGATPLMWAVFEGSRESAMRLIDAGTDVSIIGRMGDTALSAAQSYGWEDVSTAIRTRLP